MSTVGLILKSTRGLYVVESPLGIHSCPARGLFRKQGITPLVGDAVTVEDDVIIEVHPRKNELIRPPLANLDQLLFVVSMCKPAPNVLLLDKFIAICEFKGIQPILLFTKLDLAQNEALIALYRRVGIPVYCVDYSDPRSIAAVKDLLADKISAFTGNSGAGKSTLLNAIDESLGIETGEISEKLGRGRHTTRTAELYHLDNGGLIADTPGFSTFETNQYDIIRRGELADCFVEFGNYLGDCRFQDCSHTVEKGCAILEAVKVGEISKSRHESYCRMMEEAAQLKEWELK